MEILIKKIIFYTGKTFFIEKTLETIAEIIGCSPSLNLQQPQVGRMFFLTEEQSYSWNVHAEELPDSRTASPYMLLLCQTAAGLILGSPHRSAVTCSSLRSLQEAEHNA